MAVYFRGSVCGRYIKVGQTTRDLLPYERYRQYAMNTHRKIDFPHPLGYLITVGQNCRVAETSLKAHFKPYLVDEVLYGDEVFHAATPVLSYVAWFRLQWFAETDPTGKQEPEHCHYEDFEPRPDRTSTDFKEEDLTSPLEAEGNPFWFLPDVSVDPVEDYYTPPEFIEPVRLALGGIDLDVASHPAANRYVKAARYFTKSMDGLAKPWAGRVWVSHQNEAGKAWAEKAIREIRSGRVTSMVCLVKSKAAASNYIEPLLALANDVCLIVGGGPVFGGKGALTQNNSQDRWTFIYYGQEEERFASAVKHLGTVCRVLK